MSAPDSALSALRQALETSRAENARLQRILQIKDEQIKLLNFRLFGPKSEKLSSAQMPLLLAEISLTAAEVETEAERPEAQKQNPLPRARQPRPNHPGREKLPEHLERREEISKPTKRRCPARRLKRRRAATTGPIFGNTACRAGRWSLTFKWAAGARDRGSS